MLVGLYAATRVRATPYFTESGDTGAATGDVTARTSVGTAVA
jgi:hypothetical protein